MTLAALHQALVQSADSQRRAPLKWIRWLPVQYRYFTSQAQCRLLRTGNQNLGKTTIGLADLYLCATGEHPHRRCDEDGEYWVICASWPQSVAIQKKLWEMVERDRVHPETDFSQKNGFRGQNPACQVRHENGRYSLIRFKTTRQGTIDLASATIRGALFDEPPTNQAVFTEVLMRTVKLGGWVAITMTPVGAPVGWIRAMAEAGQIEDIHTRLTPAALIPVGSTKPLRLEDGTVCDAHYIRARESEVPEHERGVRVHGEWEIRNVDRYFTVFRSEGSQAHVHRRMPTGKVTVRIGIDYGTLPGKQIIGLGLSWQVRNYHNVYILDEYCDDLGTASTLDDARATIRMLHRHGMDWDSVDFAAGDRIHMPGTAQQKSNEDLMDAIAEVLGVPRESLRVKKIRTVKKGEGSMKGAPVLGSRWLWQQMNRPGGYGIHPRCVRTIGANDNYQLGKDDDYKDPIDMQRYMFDDLILPRRQGGGPTVRWG